MSWDANTRVWAYDKWMPSLLRGWLVCNSASMRKNSLPNTQIPSQHSSTFTTHHRYTHLDAHSTKTQPATATIAKANVNWCQSTDFWHTFRVVCRERAISSDGMYRKCVCNTRKVQQTKMHIEMAQHCTRRYNCHWQKKQKTTIMLIQTHSSIHFGSNANTKTLIKVFFPWISLFLPHFGHSNQLKSYRIPPENTQFNLTHTKCPKMKLLSSILLILIDFLQIKENFLSSIYQQKTSPVNYSELHKSLCNFQSKHFFIVFLDSLFVTNWKFFFFSQFLDRSGWLHFVRRLSATRKIRHKAKWNANEWLLL